MARLPKDYTAREKKEARCFMAEYYEGQDGCEFNVPERPQYYWQLWYVIKHDKDSYSESDYDKWMASHDQEPDWKVGDLKKAHYHIIGYSDSPCMLGRAATKFGIPSQYVQIVHKKKEAIQYLIHLNNPEKHQYQPDEVFTNDPKIQAILTKVPSAEEKASILCDAIFSTEIYTMHGLASFALKNQCWDELRRGQHIYSQLLAEKRYHAKESKWVEDYQGFKELYYD